MKTSLERSLIQQKAYGTYDRNRLIKSLCADGNKQAKIGKDLGLSRQRIFQIKNNRFDIRPIELTQTLYNAQESPSFFRRIINYLKKMLWHN